MSYNLLDLHILPFCPSFHPLLRWSCFREGTSFHDSLSGLTHRHESRYNLSISLFIYQFIFENFVDPPRQNKSFPFLSVTPPCSHVYNSTCNTCFNIFVHACVPPYKLTFPNWMATLLVLESLEYNIIFGHQKRDKCILRREQMNSLFIFVTIWSLLRLTLS